MLEQKYSSTLNSPLGTLTIISTDTAVIEITFGVTELIELSNSLSELAKHQLELYFEGKLKTFDFPFLQRGTEFQQQVWSNLLNIPYGTTTSYAAFSSHHPKAIRAIASANGKNNLAIVVPCHRVIGSSGKLVGYAGGLHRKQWLLEHEQKISQVGQTRIDF